MRALAPLFASLVLLPGPGWAASEEDRALNFARKVVYGLVRVGALRSNNLTIREIEMMREFSQVRLIDLAGQQGIDFFGHNHHTRNPSVSSDLILLLRHDLPPAKRGLEKTTDSPMWQFPADYAQRLGEVTRSLYPARPSGQEMARQ